jgi:hypothetical protein
MTATTRTCQIASCQTTHSSEWYSVPKTAPAIGTLTVCSECAKIADELVLGEHTATYTDQTVCTLIK